MVARSRREYPTRTFDHRFVSVGRSEEEVVCVFTTSNGKRKTWSRRFVRKAATVFEVTAIVCLKKFDNATPQPRFRCKSLRPALG
jgi:hypothetical protein